MRSSPWKRRMMARGKFSGLGSSKSEVIQVEKASIHFGVDPAHGNPGRSTGGIRTGSTLAERLQQPKRVEADHLPPFRGEHHHHHRPAIPQGSELRRAGAIRLYEHRLRYRGVRICLPGHDALDRPNPEKSGVVGIRRRLETLAEREVLRRRRRLETGQFHRGIQGRRLGGLEIRRGRYTGGHAAAHPVAIHPAGRGERGPQERRGDLFQQFPRGLYGRGYDRSGHRRPLAGLGRARLHELPGD